MQPQRSTAVLSLQAVIHNPVKWQLCLWGMMRDHRRFNTTWNKSSLTIYDMWICMPSVPEIALGPINLLKVNYTIILNWRITMVTASIPRTFIFHQNVPQKTWWEAWISWTLIKGHFGSARTNGGHSYLLFQSIVILEACGALPSIKIDRFQCMHQSWHHISISHSIIFTYKQPM